MRKINKRLIFIVAGRFGKSLTISKAMPILASGVFDRVLIFRESQGFFYPGVEYVTLDFLKAFPSKKLRKFVRLIVEPIQLIYYSLKYRPGMINGYQLVPKAYYTVLASILSGAKSMVSSVGGIPEIQTYFRLSGFFEWINIITLKSSDIVTTKGSTVTNYLINKGVEKEKVFTFNGAIDTKIFSNFGVERHIDLIFVGSLIEVKGPDRFIQIVARVAAQNKDLKVSILGEGQMQSLVEKEIDRLSLNNIITLYGYREDTVEFLRRSRILVMPSRSEGLPTAMIEAMACGCVPIISDVGCVRETAHHGRNSLVIHDYNDIQSFCDEIINLLNDPSRLRKLSENASKFSAEKYSIDAQATVFKEILQKMSYIDEP